LHDAVEIVDNVVAGVVDMARVQADPQPIAVGAPFDDGRQLFKGTADLRSLARHGFQGDADAAVDSEDLVQALHDAADAVVEIFLHEGPRVQHDVFHAHVRGALDLLLQKLHREAKSVPLGRGQVDDVRRMDDDFFDAVLLHEGQALGHVLLFHRLAPGVLRGAGVDHEGGGAVADGLFRRVEQAFVGEGDVGTDLQQRRYTSGTGYSAGRRDVGCWAARPLPPAGAAASQEGFASRGPLACPDLSARTGAFCTALARRGSRVSRRGPV